MNDTKMSMPTYCESYHDHTILQNNLNMISQPYHAALIYTVYVCVCITLSHHTHYHIKFLLNIFVSVTFNHQLIKDNIF